jgi:hypothetical protein
MVDPKSVLNFRESDIFFMSPLINGRTTVAACPRYRRNLPAILVFYNIDMFDRKANSQEISATNDVIPIQSGRLKRDSLFRRRMIGAAIIISLALLGFAFPVII